MTTSCPGATSGPYVDRHPLPLRGRRHGPTRNTSGEFTKQTLMTPATTQYVHVRGIECWRVQVIGMNAVRSLVAAVPALVVLATPKVVLADGRVALVVGNSAYAHIGRLPNPDNDARELVGAVAVWVRSDDRAGRRPGGIDQGAARAFTRKLCAGHVLFGPGRRPQPAPINQGGVGSIRTKQTQRIRESIIHRPGARQQRVVVEHTGPKVALRWLRAVAAVASRDAAGAWRRRRAAADHEPDSARAGRGWRC